MGTYDPLSFQALTWHDAVPRFLSGEDSPPAYLERCLAVIDEREPTLRAWTALCIDRAKGEAAASHERHCAGRALSAIDGMPIGIKDLIPTEDMPTGEGIAGNEGAMPGMDAPCVQALRAAGAVILGKLATTELGQGRPAATTNPFDAARTPGGSSMGSAAAIGAGMLPAALGTQLGGSIIRPAALCGNVAFKPSFGALRRGDRVGYSHSSLGVHANCVEDAWQVAMAIASRVGGDPGHPGLEGPQRCPAASPPRRVALVPTDGWPLATSRAVEALEDVLAQLAAMGIDVLRPRAHAAVGGFAAELAGLGKVAAVISGFEARPHFEALAKRHSLSDAILASLDRSRRLTVADYRAALERRSLLQAAHARLAAHASAWITLGCPGPAPLIAGPHDDPWKPGAVPRTGNPAFNLPASVLWAPAWNLPLMAVDGLPVGLQLVGPYLGDAALAGHARWMMDHLRPVSR